MAVIEVNYQALRSLAQAIDQYCDEHDRQLRLADAGVRDMLSVHWQGPDATEFDNSWRSSTTGSAAPAAFRESMESYADALNASAALYQRTQEDLYNLSCALPR